MIDEFDKDQDGMSKIWFVCIKIIQSAKRNS